MLLIDTNRANLKKLGLSIWLLPNIGLMIDADWYTDQKRVYIGFYIPFFLIELNIEKPWRK